MSSAAHPFKGFAKIVAKGDGHLAAVVIVAEGSFRLLEVEITFGFIGIEYIADRQFEAAFVLKYLFGDGCRTLAQGLDDNLAFHAFGAIETGDLAAPSVGKAELVGEIEQQVGC